MAIQINEQDCLTWKDLAKIAEDNNLFLEKLDISIGNSSPSEYRYIICAHLDDKIVAKKTDPPEEKAQGRVREIIDRIHEAGRQVDELVSDIKKEYTIAI